MNAPDQGPAPPCDRCGTLVGLCAFCQREECSHPMCYRCVRIALRQEIPQPHRHGG